MNTRNKLWLYVFILALPALLASCNKNRDNLTGEWRLTSLDGIPAVEGSAVTIRFDGTQVSGFGGCNTYSGGYTAKGGKIELTDLSMTLMACQDSELNEQETSFFITLNLVDRYTVSQESLTLRSSDVELEFIPAQGQG